MRTVLGKKYDEIINKRKKKFNEEIQVKLKRELNNNNPHNNINNDINNNFGNYDNNLNQKAFDNNNDKNNNKDFKENNNNKNNEFNIININNDNLLDNDIELRKKTIDFKSIQKPPLVKLEILNNTNPLVNIVLRCLSIIRTLILYYFNPCKEQKILQKSIANPNRKYLGPSFLRLLDNLWKSRKEKYSPREIHEVLSELMLNKYNSNDPGIIMNFILNQLDDELIINRVNNIVNVPYMQFNEKESLQKFCELIMKNQTKISDCFFSIIKINKYCKICQQISYIFSRYPVINIYIETTQNGNLSLEGNLDILFENKENEYIKENCIICGCETEKKVSQFIYITSEILIFNINREKDPNNDKNFKYPMNFDGNKVINKDIQLPNYKLITVIKKVVNNNNIFFVAYCKSFIDGQWYMYYNNNIEIFKNKNDLIDEKRTCLLIYSAEKKINSK